MQNETSSSATQSTINDYDIVAAMILSAEQSIASALGIILNLVIMFTMPFADMNRRIKLLLTALAFADFGATLMNGFVAVALTSIVPLFTHQPFLASSINLSACVSTQFLADFFEASVQWMTACLTMERFYVVYFPFKAAQLTLRTTLMIVVGTFVICFLATSPHFAFYTITAVGGQCVPGNTDYATSMSYFILRHLVYEHVIAPSIILTCNALVLVRLTRRERAKKHDQVNQDKKKGDSSKLRITVTLVAISTLHVCGFVPCGIICFIWYCYADTTYGAMAYQNIVISYAAYGVMHCINFFMYASTMPAYRDVLKHPPVCSYKRKK